MKDIAPSFSTESLGNHLTTPVPAQMSQRLPGKFKKSVKKSILFFFHRNPRGTAAIIV